MKFSIIATVSIFPRVFFFYLSGNVGVLFSIAVAVVGIDVVRALDPVHWLQDNPAVVVSYHVRIP
jgi:hypothetical protein